MKKYRTRRRLVWSAIAACMLVLLACHRHEEGTVSSEDTPSSVEAGISEAEGTSSIDGLSSGVRKTSEKPSSALVGWVQTKVDHFVTLYPQIPQGLTLHIVGREGDSQGWKRFSAAATEMVKQLNQSYGLKKEEAISLVIDGSTKQENLENQINVWDNLLVKSPDVMALSAVDMFSMKPQLEAAAESAIPVIGFDSGIVDEGYDKSYSGVIETDYHQIGRDLMERLQRAGVLEGKVLILGSSDKTMSVQQMISGLEEYRSENLPRLERATVLYRNREADMTRLEDAKQWQGYAAVVGLSQNEVQAALTLREKLAKPENQDKPPVVTGLGYTSKWTDDIEEQKLLGVFDINHREVACATVAMSLEKAMAVLEQKEDAFHRVKVAHAWIDLETMETEAIKNMLE
ncbi:MAG: substrate-binding domain-containing protein [Eubacteriales bacterium]|nr:substrate-binding domain-containing protein [Eubacteriales bacterium]